MTEAAPLVLVVEDEVYIRRFVVDALRRDGYRAAEAASAGAGLDLAAAQRPDLVLLDLGLPDFGGVEFISRLREWSPVPLLVLSALSAETDKVRALDAGADDYLAKPFGIAEMLARVRVLLRRHPAGAERSPLANFGDVAVDLARRTVHRAGEPVHLTDIEFRLLSALIASEGTVATHRRLLETVWGPGHRDQAHYLRIYVARLRRKLEADPAQPEYFLTETGAGYRFRSTTEY